MNVLCYCEANSKTGFGHYVRIKNLKKILNKKIKFDIVTKNTKLAKKFFKKIKVIELKNDIFNFLKHNKNRYDVIIFDPPYYPNKKNINFNLKLKKFYQNQEKPKIVILTDEVKATPKYCDLLINDYPGSTKYSKFYKKFNTKIKLNLGIYSFLYPKKCFIKKLEKKKYDLFVAFGGSDSKNILNKFFKEIKNIRGKKIILTNSKTYAKIKNYMDNNLIIKKTLNYDHYLKHLSKSKFYLSTPSNIMFEAYSLGICGIVIPTQDRQYKMGRYFHKTGLTKCLNYYKSLKKNQIYKNYNQLKLEDKKIVFPIKKAHKNQVKIINSIEKLI